MLAAQMFLLASSVLLSGFSLLGLLTPAALLGFTFLIGCGTAINGPAWQSLVGEMVPGAEIPAAIALNSVGPCIPRARCSRAGPGSARVEGAGSRPRHPAAEWPDHR